MIDLNSGDALSPAMAATRLNDWPSCCAIYDHSAVQVTGFTDTVGPFDRNIAISQSRAKTVADGLVSDGVDSERVSSQGYGATHLKIATGPDRAEPRNRRIEIRVIAHPQA